MKPTRERLDVRTKPMSYQLTKAEMEKDVGIDASPEDTIRAAFRQVKAVEDPDA